MSYPIDKKRVWFQVALLLLEIATLAGLLVYARTKPLNKSDLKIPISESRSQAAAARMVAAAAQEAKMSQTFYEAQIIMLRQKVDDAASQLASAHVQDGLEIKLWQAQRLIGELKTTLEWLETSFGKQDQLNQRKQELDDLVPRLRELEETLN
jgi:hypothetical protein